jgi:hypothetical protein
VSPNPQLDEPRTAVGDVLPDACVGLAIGDVAERSAIDPGQDPPVDDEVIDAFGKRVVPAADGHLLRPCGEIGVGGLAIIEVGPDAVVWLSELAVKVAQDDEWPRPLCRRVNPALEEAQAAIAPDTQRLKAWMAHDCEPALKGKTGILLSIQRTLGTVIDVHVIDLQIDDPTEGRLTIDLLDRQDIRVEEPHVAADALIIRGDAFDGRVRLGT